MKPHIRPFDITEMLQDDESIAEYLTLVMEDGDPALLAASLGDIARARGMTQMSAAPIGTKQHPQGLEGPTSQGVKKRPEPQSPGRKSTKMSGNCWKHDAASIL